MTKQKSEDRSLTRRLLSKISNNVSTVFIGCINLFILPRSLGIEFYGVYEFLVAYYTQLKQLLALGIAKAVYTKVSKKPDELGYIYFSIFFTIAVFVLLIIFLLMIGFSKFSSIIWPNVNYKYVLAASILGYTYWLSDLARFISDAIALTVVAEKYFLIIRLAGIAGVICLYFLSLLTLDTLLLKDQFVYLVSAVAIIVYLWKKFYSSKINKKDLLDIDKTRKAAVDIFKYSYPLVTLTLFGVLVVFFERWMVMKFYGAEEQAFFGWCLRIATIAIVICTAFSRIIGREFAVHVENDSLNELKATYIRFFSITYFIAAFFSIFISFNSSEVIRIFSIPEFRQAVTILQIISLYPIYQAIGQFNRQIFHAYEMTKFIRNVGMISLFFGLITSWLVLAPDIYGGFELGGEGLAFKMTLFPVIIINVQAFYICKFILKTTYLSLFYVQVKTCLLLSFILLMIRFFTNIFDFSIVLFFFLNGIIYSFVVGLTVLLLPKYFSMDVDVKKILRKHFVNN